jgi:hypothetical protein
LTNIDIALAGRWHHKYPRKESTLLRNSVKNYKLGKPKFAPLRDPTSPFRAAVLDSKPLEVDSRRRLGCGTTREKRDWDNRVLIPRW